MTTWVFKSAIAPYGVGKPHIYFHQYAVFRDNRDDRDDLCGSGK